MATSAIKAVQQPASAQLLSADDPSKVLAEFSFQNNTTGLSIPTVDLGLVDNYAKIMDEPNEVRLTNLTASADQGELVTTRSRRINRVATELQIMYPARVEAGVEYGARLDEILRIYDANGVILCDLPIVCSVNFKHALSPYITDAIIEQVYGRMNGVCYSQTEKKFRFGEWMRQALSPRQN